jgi:hypothetical protein
VRCTRRPGNIPHDGTNVNLMRLGIPPQTANRRSS